MARGVLFVNPIVLLKKHVIGNGMFPLERAEEKILLSRSGGRACDRARLDAGSARAPCPAMPATAPILARLRRSVLGAWLASAYALAVLAAMLAPAPAFAAHAALDGAVLCSGQPAPDQNAPASDGGQLHCLGCPARSIWQVEEGGSSAKRWTPLPRKPRRRAKNGRKAGGGLSRSGPKPLERNRWRGTHERNRPSVVRA